MKKALRFNEGKLKWSLVHFKSLEPLIQVLMFGASKYTKSVCLTEESLLSLCQLWEKEEFVRIVTLKKGFVQKDCVQAAIELQATPQKSAGDVEKLDYYDLKVCADLAVKQNGLKRILQQKMLERNTKKCTERSLNLERKKELEILKEERILRMLQSKNAIPSLEILNSEESPNLFISKDVSKVAEFADLTSDYTSIMTIKQEDTVIYFVVNATKHLDCLMILLKNLQKQKLIWKPITRKGNKIILHEGVNNWKKKMNTSEILESSMRHLTALFDGEENDKESKLSHAGHVMCNMMFYIYHKNKKK